MINYVNDNKLTYWAVSDAYLTVGAAHLHSSPDACGVRRCYHYFAVPLGWLGVGGAEFPEPIPDEMVAMLKLQGKICNE